MLRGKCKAEKTVAYFQDDVTLIAADLRLLRSHTWKFYKMLKFNKQLDKQVIKRCKQMIAEYKWTWYKNENEKQVLITRFSLAVS